MSDLIAQMGTYAEFRKRSLIPAARNASSETRTGMMASSTRSIIRFECGSSKSTRVTFSRGCGRMARAIPIGA